MPTSIAALTPATQPIHSGPVERAAPDVPDMEFNELWQDKEEGLSFGDFLEIINPLQHIPVVSTLYRMVTGDEIGVRSASAGVVADRHRFAVNSCQHRVVQCGAPLVNTPEAAFHHALSVRPRRSAEVLCRDRRYGRVGRLARVPGPERGSRRCTGQKQHEHPHTQPSTKSGWLQVTKPGAGKWCRSREPSSHATAFCG